MKGLLQMVKLGLMSSLTVDGVVYTKESPEVAAVEIERIIHQPVINTMTWGRNDPCPCGSGRKYKKCCLNSQLQLQPA